MGPNVYPGPITVIIVKKETEQQDAKRIELWSQISIETVAGSFIIGFCIYFLSPHDPKFVLVETSHASFWPITDEAQIFGLK